MKLHDLRPAEGSRTPKTRVGRGIAAGKGKTAGRGTKGQKARAGGSIPPWFEGGQTPLHRRIPKLRGFRNRFKIDFEVVNVGAIAAAAERGAFETDPHAKGTTASITINQDILRAVGLVRTLNKPLKILGGGELSHALFIVADAFTASARACFSWAPRAAASRGCASSRTRASRAASLPARGSKAQRGLAARATRSLCIRASFLHSAWPKAIASSMVSSGTSLAPASTMSTASSVPAITSSSVDTVCSAVVGLTTNRPSTCPTRTAPTGPSNGMPDRQSAADAPFIARTSGSFSWSPETTRQMTWTSFLKPSGNSGRIGRSISRDVRVSFLTGAPSRLK